MFPNFRELNRVFCRRGLRFSS